MKYIKLYESDMSFLKDYKKWFKKNREPNLPKEIKEITIDGITFRVGGWVKRKVDDVMGEIIDIDYDGILIIVNIKPIGLEPDSPFYEVGYTGVYEPNELYTDEETEIGPDVKKYNV